ncbi:hypothetical protein F511_15760 [Dorcoceras hygrometricum]|uniref:Uncharacterized protein n=1 Tax=Dorcoceras hygrometricum TaxID=472368 RepID=A0A2Z7BJP0_9LAMI|nr:hypothetical protein F511_15760 [Dorcoceras hygrometricum]
MTSSQSAVSYSGQQLSKSYQQMSRQAQEMKRRRRRRFQSQATIEEAVVNYYSRSCQQLPFILLLTNLSAVAILITVDESKLLADTITEAVGRNHHLKGKESVAEIKSCKLPQFKETRFVLFWEIVQLTEERCTEMERSDELALTSAEQFWNLSNDHIQTKAIYAKATPLKKVDDVGATTALLQKYIDYTVHQQRKNKKKDEAIDRH